MSKVIEVDASPNKELKTSTHEVWYKIKLDDESEAVAMSLYPLVKAIQNKQMYRRVQNLRHARLYSNLEILGLQPGMFARTAMDLIPGHRVTFNVIQSCVDTVTSKIAKIKPRIVFMTSDGNWTQRRKAKKLSSYILGVFEDSGLYKEKEMSFRDSGIFGTGATKIYIENDRIKAERVFIDEIVVEDSDGMYCQPQSLHQIRYVTREVLSGMFPDKKDKIMSAPSGIPADFGSTKDLLRVVESWHLKSGQDVYDGRHAIVIEGVTLLYEEYEKSYFPFVFDRWNKRVIGFFGQGIAEILTGIQIEMNKVMRTIQRSIHLMAVPRVFINAASKVTSAHINNDPGSIVKFSGEPPIFNTSPVMPPEVYAYIENLYQKAYQIVGVSMLSAASKKPEGLNSGIALREYQDVESERFELTAKQYENSFVEAASICLDLTRDLLKAGKKPYTQVKYGKKTEFVNFEEVDMEDDEFMIKAFPSSMLPTQPAGRFQFVTEMIQAGFLDKAKAIELLDMPDVEGFFTLETASIEDVRRLIENMLEYGIYESPEPYMNLDQTKQMMQSAYLSARSEGCPDDRLDLLRQFMSDIDDMQAKAKEAAAQQMMLAQQQAAMAQGGMPPVAKPEMAPQSALMPMKPQVAGGMPQ